MAGEIAALGERGRMVRALAEGLGEDVVPSEKLAALDRFLHRIERRSGYMGRTLLIALAGGTGSGKSSLLNALAGADLAEVGVARPTTDHAVAWLPNAPHRELPHLLDELNIDDRRSFDSYRHLAVVDLPDFDSYITSHRAQAERLIDEADAVVWVVDPEKYNDPILREDFLTPLKRRSARFLVVLNQIDRIPREDRPELLADLRSRLDTLGLNEATVLAVAARPPEEAPMGIDLLRSELEHRLNAKAMVREGIADEALEAVDGFPRPFSFDLQWQSVRTSSLEHASADGVGLVLAFVDDVSRHLNDGGALRHEIDAEGVATTLAPVRERRWWQFWKRSSAALDLVGSGEQLDKLVADPCRAALRPRAELSAAIAEFVVAAEAFRPADQR